MSKVRSLVVASTFAVVASFLGGCVVHARGGVAATYDTGPSELVEVSPGVWVVADYDEPVFYSDGYYWSNRGGLWYRSSYYDYGFTRVAVVPTHIRGIRRPRRYVHYRARGRARTRAIRPAHRYYRGNRRSNVRDHRTYRGRDNRYDNRRGYDRGPTRTRTRDHRTYDRGNYRNNTRDHRTPTRTRNRTRDHRTYNRGNTRRNTRDHRDSRSKSRDHRRRHY